MPRGRKRKQSEMLEAFAEAVGPALKVAVAAKKDEEIKAEEKKPVKWCKIRFTNLEDPGLPMEFNYMGIDVKLEEGKDIDVQKSVVTWVNSLKVPRSQMVFDPNKGNKVIKHVFRPRVICEIIEEYEK